MSSLILFTAGFFAFITGLQWLQKSLENIAARRLKKLMTKITATPLRGFFYGTVITAAVQSSSAVTALSISLVNAGLLSFSQTIGLILGTNIGTTITVQLFVFNFEILSWPLLALSLIIILLSSNRRQFYTGLAGAGFCLLFLGLWGMARGVSPLQYSPLFLQFLSIMGEHLLLAVAAGIIVTMVLQSSSTVAGMLVVLARADLITLTPATAVILGSNLGTCITAILASMYGNRAGKQVALAHVLLNLLGIIVFLPWLETFSSLMAKTSPLLTRQIANAHFFYNLLSSLALLPFAGSYAKLITRLFPD